MLYAKVKGMSVAARVLRIAAGAALGGAVGWVGHDRFNKRKTGLDSREFADNLQNRQNGLSWTKEFKITIPWDDNWDRLVYH